MRQYRIRERPTRSSATSRQLNLHNSRMDSGWQNVSSIASRGLQTRRLPRAQLRTHDAHGTRNTISRLVDYILPTSDMQTGYQVYHLCTLSRAFGAFAPLRLRVPCNVQGASPNCSRSVGQRIPGTHTFSISLNSSCSHILHSTSVCAVFRSFSLGIFSTLLRAC